MIDLHEVERDFSIPETTFCEILTEILEMTRIFVKCIPKFLVPEHKNFRYEIAKDNLQKLTDIENVP